jgi:hypothetical protein
MDAAKALRCAVLTRANSGRAMDVSNAQKKSVVWIWAVTYCAVKPADFELKGGRRGYVLHAGLQC